MLVHKINRCAYVYTLQRWCLYICIYTFVKTYIHIDLHLYMYTYMYLTVTRCRGCCKLFVAYHLRLLVTPFIRCCCCCNCVVILANACETLRALFALTSGIEKSSRRIKIIALATMPAGYSIYTLTYIHTHTHTCWHFGSEIEYQFILTLSNIYSISSLRKYEVAAN